METKTNQVPQQPVPNKVYRSESFFRSAIKRLFRHKLAVFGMIIIAFFVLVTVFANQIATHSITAQNLRNRFSPPNNQITLPVDLAVGRSVRVTAFSSGEVYSRDPQLNLPKWHKQLHVGATAVAMNDNAAFVAASDGAIFAYELNRGSDLWMTDVGGKPTAIWVTPTDVLVLEGDSTVHHLDSDGNILGTTKLGEKVVKTSSLVMSKPIVVTEQGELYLVENGSLVSLGTLPERTVKVAAQSGDKLFFISDNGLFVYGLDDSTVRQLPDFPSIAQPFGLVTEFQNTLLMTYGGSNYAGYDLAAETLTFTESLDENIIEMAHDDARLIQIATDQGRILTINPATGGIMSSRMLEGYKDINYLGTDELGRDVFSRILAGGRVSLSLGLLVSLICVTIGSIVGAITGYYGGIIDTLVMRFVDFMLSIPTLPMLMLVSFILGPSFETMTIVLVIFGWMSIARIVRGQTLSLKQQEFFLAAQALGVSTPRIILRHLLPNTIGPIVVAATLQVGRAILSESQLSYLGLGIQPPTPSWGNMLMQARSYLTQAPFLALWPGLCIFLVLLAINFFGDGLRDAFDPKLKGR